MYERFISASEPNEERGGFRSSERLRVIPLLLPVAEKKDIPTFLWRHLYADLRKPGSEQYRADWQKLNTAVIGPPRR